MSHDNEFWKATVLLTRVQHCRVCIVFNGSENVKITLKPAHKVYAIATQGICIPRRHTLRTITKLMVFKPIKLRHCRALSERKKALPTTTQNASRQRWHHVWTKALIRKPHNDDDDDDISLNSIKLAVRNVSEKSATPTATQPTNRQTHSIVQSINGAGTNLKVWGGGRRSAIFFWSRPSTFWLKKYK